MMAMMEKSFLMVMLHCRAPNDSEKPSLESRAPIEFRSTAHDFRVAVLEYFLGVMVVPPATSECPAIRRGMQRADLVSERLRSTL